MSNKNHNPDILTCLANLSSDEVFTPPAVANEMLDLLPASIGRDKNAKFLDPFCKSGVFLREITKRLVEGLKKEIPDEQKRVNHILKNQVFGIAITELTALLSRRSLYCSKSANSEYSICEVFDEPAGNVIFDKIKHSWKDGHCVFCGASKEANDRDDSLEAHAYQFIHTNNPEKIFPMKFDVIIGNPPYQMSDGGFGRSASPIYHEFVKQAKKLSPRYLAMIIPSRWFSGGKGLDEFRSDMLNDKRLRKIYDFENSSDVFPGVDVAGGICYFLWERDNPGECEVVNMSGERPTSTIRPLNEFNVFVRNSRAISVIRKIKKSSTFTGRFLSERVSPSKPFGIRTFYEPKNSGIPCYFVQKIGLKFASRSEISDEHNLLDKHKLLLPKAPIAGQTDFSKPVGFYYDGNVRVAKPGECCTESFIVAGAFDTKSEVLAFKSYLFTKTVRYLLLQTVVSQDVTRKNFCFVPDLEKYEGEYTDAKLRKLWNITDEEWQDIDTRISAIKENE